MRIITLERLAGIGEAMRPSAQRVVANRWEP